LAKEAQLESVLFNTGGQKDYFEKQLGNDHYENSDDEEERGEYESWKEYAQPAILQYEFFSLKTWNKLEKLIAQRFKKGLSMITMKDVKTLGLSNEELIRVIPHQLFFDVKTIERAICRQKGCYCILPGTTITKLLQKIPFYSDVFEKETSKSKKAKL